MEFLEPWFANSDPRIVAELHREMPRGHVIEAVEISAVASRKDCDEVLYALNDGSDRFAIVHLTLSKSRETDPRFPETWIFRNHEILLEYMQAAHAAWAGHEEDPDGQFWLKEQRLRARAKPESS